MSSVHHSNDGFNGDSNYEINESHSLILKLFANVLNNSTVQTGLKQLTRLSQPIIGRFDDNIFKITSNVGRWVSSENVYNQLATIWLAHNYPFNGRVIAYEDFIKECQSLLRDGRRHENEYAIKHFYTYASEIWKSLGEPDSSDIKFALLASVAKVINKTYHFEEETLATALYNMIRMLVEKRKQLVSGESFFNLVKVSLGEDYYEVNQQLIRKACTEYYTFAKRFILIDFPLSTNNKDVLKLILNFIQDNGFYYGDFALNFVEKQLDFLLKVTGQPRPEGIEDNTLVEKAQRILQKTLVLSTYPFKKAEDVFHQVQTTQLYITADHYLNINDKIDYSIALTTRSYNFLKEGLLVPTINTITVFTNNVRSKVTVIIHNLDIDLLKKRYNKLHAQYEVLQKCVLMIADESVRLIFDKQALAELGENGKKELFRLYHDVKTMETQKLKEFSIEYYSKILKKAQETYKNASKVVYYKKKEIGDQEGASAVRPSDDKEIDAFDNNSQSKNFIEREAVETAALESLN